LRSYPNQRAVIESNRGKPIANLCCTLHRSLEQPSDTSATGPAAAATSQQHQGQQQQHRQPSQQQQQPQQDAGLGDTLSSLPQASFNYINSIVGSGVIGIPYALHRAGFGLGLALLILVAYITDYSLILMVSGGP